MADPLCIIPARGSSDNFPKKNFKRIDGTPLVAHTIESALETTRIGEVIVSTESEELAEISRKYGAEVPFLRPSRLSKQDVLLTEVIDHAISELSKRNLCEIEDKSPIVVLQPNVPFTRPGDIDAALLKYESKGHRAVLSVTEEQDFFWQASNDHLTPYYEDRILRSKLEPLYRETGSIYVTNRSILAEGDRVGETPSYIVTDKLSAFEVETLVDLWLAERIKQGPKVVFRVDGGDEIGMGHVYRCLTLAQELRDAMNGDIIFVTDDHYSGGLEKLQSTEFDVVSIKDHDETELLISLGPDIIFLDILNTTDRYTKALHETSAAVINLEDLGSGAGHADYVINALYEGKSDSPNQLFGADYFVLEEEYYQQRGEIATNVENILLTFGGSDPSNLSTRIVKEVGMSDLLYDYRLVLGPDFMHKEEFATLPEELISNVEVLNEVSEMGELMRWADVAICSGGRTVYELAATGTPALVLAHNNREADRMQDLDAIGVIEFLGLASDIEEGVILKELNALDEDYKRRKEMSEKSQEFVDGSGVQRILDLVHDIMIR